jgi:hypothetical protein
LGFVFFRSPDLAVSARRYYERKRAEGKTNLAALRCLKRVLAGIVYYRLRAAGQVVSRMDAQSESNGTTAMAA